METNEIPPVAPVTHVQSQLPEYLRDKKKKKEDSDRNNKGKLVDVYA